MSSSVIHFNPRQVQKQAGIRSRLAAPIMSLHTTPERSAPAMDAHNAAISDANRRSRVPSGGSMTHATLSTHTAW
jgi:hypothetical protein